MIDAAQLRRIVEKHFRVYEAREERVRKEVAAHLFYVMFPPNEFDRRFVAARSEIIALDTEAVVFMRRDHGEDILFIAARPPALPLRPGLHLGLLAATLVTTTLAGAASWQGYVHGDAPLRLSALWSPTNLLWGVLTFAVPLLLILGIHESAHFVAARRHRLRATLPYFIPAPPLLMPIGTFGAFISMKDPLPDRKALFDVGASGPLAGFLVALPVVLLGTFLTSSMAVPLPDYGRPEIGADLPHDLNATAPGLAVLTFHEPSPGWLSFNVTAPHVDEDWGYAASAHLTFANGTTRDEAISSALAAGRAERRSLAVPKGTTAIELRITWDDHLVNFGNPLLIEFTNRVWPTDNLMSHPTFIAGWAGLLVTGINLMPIGQLDGGHVSRAVFGERSRYIAFASALLLVGLTWFFASWVVMAIFVILMGIHHPPPLNDRTVLDRRRLVLAAVVLAVLVLCFVPVPISP